MTKRQWTIGGLTALALALTGAQSAGVLAKIQPGQWQLKEVGADGGGRALCVADPAVLLQLVHGDTRCTRTVIDSGPTALTVSYSCPGAGNGRTTLTLHSAGAFRLQTQGLSAGAPFDYDYEAKRVGDCPAGASTPSPSGTR